MNDSKLEFQKLYDDFQPKILRYVARLIGDDEAEDLTQEIFVKVSRALVDFRGESSLSTWLYRVATHAAVDRMRSRAGQPAMLPEPQDTLTENADTPAHAPSVEQQLVRKQMDECLLEFISQLPENYRTVFVLSELEALKNQEIADILGVNLNTVKVRLHRARLKLKEDLLAHCGWEWVEGNEFLPDFKKILKNV
jgi:RNA polymerase sigma-70 factor (ECF subfamily)